MKRKRCYYEVLELSLKSTLSQIRHSYHKLAMKWHPDKNKSDEAKDKFQEISEAYSILGNPSEKTWYDRHRETIIKNWNAATETHSAFEGGRTITNGGGTYWPYFMRPAFLGYDDTDSGFYTVYRNVFNAIKDGVEEMNILVNEAEDNEQMEAETERLIVRAPSFGDSETRLGKVAQFYYYWENLIPFIEETWSNLHYMDSSRNLELSEEELYRRERLTIRFIEMIKNLVQFVKTKDPRYTLYLQNKALIDEEEKERQDNDDEAELANALKDKEYSQELELFDNAQFGREVCLECWNWANLHLNSLLQLDPKDIDWASILFGALKKVADSKSQPREESASKFPALEPPDNGFPENQREKSSRDKMIEEDLNTIPYEKDL